MNEQLRKRPFMVWVICLVGWLGAVSQVLSQILLISVTEIQADPVQEIIKSWNLFDKIIPLITASLLFISMIFLFRLKLAALKWYSIYMTIIIILTVPHLLSLDYTTKQGMFSLKMTLAGLFIMGMIWIYVFWLRSKGKLFAHAYN